MTIPSIDKIIRRRYEINRKKREERIAKKMGNQIVNRMTSKLFQIGSFIVVIICILNSATMVSGSSINNGPIIGIDLGTTQSVVSIYDNGKVTIIPNDQGNRLTPSIVSFYENDRLIGDAAYNIMNKNPKNTIFDVKRFIGRSFDDPTVQRDMKLLPFDVINKNNKPYFRISFQNKIHEFSAEEISAMVLTKMKQTAEAYLGKKIERAVVTVPAYFDDTQRQATKDAGSIAGLDVVRIINEPTSAAIAYGIDKRDSIDRELNVIVYDLGGGTFDVSLLTLDEGIFEVQANGGDTHLGGSDFDENILKYMIKQFKRKTNLDITKNDKALSKLRKECEKAKRSLSSMKQTKIEIENLMNGEDFSELLTRARFEELNLKLFKKTIKPLKQLLSDANLKKNDIDEIVLVGGSTRIPKIQSLVKDFFNGKELNHGINPDEAVSFGASVQGAIISGIYGNNGEPDIVLINSTPLSLGIETVGGIMTKIMERNTVYPNTKSQIFSTHQDNQQSVLIQIFQGERALTKDNIFLGKFMINNIEPKPRGIPQIEVTFIINADGILEVEAYDKSNVNTKETLTITRDDQHNLSQEEIDRMVEEQEKWAEKDEEIIKTVNAKNKLESNVYQLKYKIYELNENNEMNSDDYDKLSDLCESIIEWLDDNTDTAEYDDYYEKQQEFDQIVNQIFNQYKGGGHSNDGYDEDYTDHEDL